MITGITLTVPATQPFPTPGSSFPTPEGSEAAQEQNRPNLPQPPWSTRALDRTKSFYGSAFLRMVKVIRPYDFYYEFKKINQFPFIKI